MVSSNLLNTKVQQDKKCRHFHVISNARQIRQHNYSTTMRH